ncbi:MAG TPA: fumarylacetoacetate hydrolase family protein [Amycolatopsis sp.]|nr:fumarylacetoacetate hydrolase family protein [Amycolatopsis sp.]
MATLRQGGPDGTLAVVTPEGDRALVGPGGIATFQEALDDWRCAGPVLEMCYERLVADSASGEPVTWRDLASPLPRAFEWCEASSYLPHLERMRAARAMTLPPEHTREPIAYQAGASTTLTPLQDIPLPDPAWGLDLEATLAVITDHVPIGTSAGEAADRVLFLVLTNDLTYRNLIAGEFRKAVGPYQAKPAKAYAPLAVSTRSLAGLWDGRILRSMVKAWVNGVPLGALPSHCDYAFDFGDILAFLTRTRALAPGSIVGLGTVASRDAANGFGCIGEKRAAEAAEHGAPHTPWLNYGDVVRIEAFGPDGRSLFGAINQTVIRPGARGTP